MVKSWHSAAMFGLELLHECYLQQGLPLGRSCDELKGREVSLMSVRLVRHGTLVQTAAFVYWRKNVANEGWILNIEDDCFVYPAFVTPTKLDAEIIHPALGVGLSRSSTYRTP
eukprot:2041264-Karenia_brevis.AAC.1